MDIGILLQGLLLGFSIAAPVGPIGVLCIRRTLSDGRAHGLISGLGAASADAVYGCIAAFGLTWVSGFLVQQQVWMRLAGGVFLLYLGIKTLLAKPSDKSAEAAGRGLMGAYGSTFLLTLTNPMTILSFTAVFAGLGLASAGGGYGSAGLLVMGVFAGSALWWFLLSGGISLLRGRATECVLLWVNRVSGLIITGFGIAALFSVLQGGV